MEEIFEWRRILFNDLPAVFLLEVAFRTVIMFIFLVVTLRASGKRGVKQLSIYEVVIIVALGSAAGDPMFYEDVGIVPALLVFLIVIGLYRLLTWLAGRNEWFESKVEGDPVYLIEDGEFAIDKFNRESLSQDEFFSELRVEHVEHLGQVKIALLETSGEMSIYFYEDQDVKPGLPILPAPFSQKLRQIPEAGIYACAFCGNVEKIPAGINSCDRCNRDLWVKAIQTRRIG
ncbi:DUF421 domain-containing protein [Adhaeribacter sp. BT258]|uniref:DUF421 domain-containing protein n=1 Tax=Adhaeribacter terrigena TaxID=2793070 RepID=A0ABS1BYL6_9BACT|nr:YetF domain-containing protein [Adhaeribacter terrigena]MBK0402241.1 DUF421 domain-containing protein [Adhaeribacter terrigena]